MLRLQMLALFALLACSQPQTAKPPEIASAAAAPAASPSTEGDDWQGNWAGVEGTSLRIEKAGEPGHYKITEGTLDGVKNHDGVGEGDAVVFLEGGKKFAIRATDGDGAGMKWLAGKKNCLVIEVGSRGFCRLGE